MSARPTSPQSAQSATALSLIRSGLSLQLAGLLWGGVVQATPYPRLALTAHIQLMAEGAMVLLAGFMLLQTSIIRIGVLQSRLVYWGFGGVWVLMVAECVNAFWGTNQILPIAAMQAGAKGALGWQELLMTAAHVVPAIGLICAYAILVIGAFGQYDNSKLKD